MSQTLTHVLERTNELALQLKCPQLWTDMQIVDNSNKIHLYSIQSHFI